MTFKDHIDAMKNREHSLRSKADECFLKADAIQKERIELELFIERKQQEENELTGK